MVGRLNRFQIWKLELDRYKNKPNLLLNVYCVDAESGKSLKTANHKLKGAALSRPFERLVRRLLEIRMADSTEIERVEKVIREGYAGFLRVSVFYD